MGAESLQQVPAAVSIDSRRSAAALKVGVLVDLPLAAGAGGHVKCWERLASAACEIPDQLDLTVHFVGNQSDEITIAGNVRYVTEPQNFSTRRFGFLSHVPEHADLAPWHPNLARRLSGYDVIHSSDAYFAYARTALHVARRNEIPLVNSVHTNTPEYARLFTGQTIERVFGNGVLTHLLRDWLAIPARIERRMQRQLRRYQQACAFTFVSRPVQLEEVKRLTEGRAGLLRRGVDRRFFSPVHRDRAWLAQSCGIPADQTVVLYAGRLNRGKNVATLSAALTQLVRMDARVHLICAGDGSERAAIAAALGPRVSCLGTVEPEYLARLYASADLFAFPSEIEEFANVVPEALASGLPVLIAEKSDMGRIVVPEVTGLVLSGKDPAAWSAAIAAIAANPERRRDLSRAARAYAELRLPSWREVLEQDLLPRWRSVTAARHAAAA
jgi:glycosyltransferase involved in cell wall biosynthesis